MTDCLFFYIKMQTRVRKPICDDFHHLCKFKSSFTVFVYIYCCIICVHLVVRPRIEPWGTPTLQLRVIVVDILKDIMCKFWFASSLMEGGWERKQKKNVLWEEKARGWIGPVVRLSKQGIKLSKGYSVYWRKSVAQLYVTQWKNLKCSKFLCSIFNYKHKNMNVKW